MPLRRSGTRPPARVCVCVRSAGFSPYSGFRQEGYGLKPALRTGNGSRTPMKTMKALVKKKREEGLWLEEVPVPPVGINDVLIEVLRTGICGTDVHIYNWDAWAQKTIPVPMVVGHEFVGRIVQVGEQRARLRSRRHRQRRGARRLRPVPQLPGRPAAPVQGHQGRRRQPPRRVRRVPRPAGDQRLAARLGRWQPRLRHLARRAVDLRPLRQRGAHGPAASTCSARTC